MTKKDFVERVFLFFFPQLKIPVWLVKKLKPYRLFEKVIHSRSISRQNTIAVASISDETSVKNIDNPNKEFRKKPKMKLGLPAKLGIGSGVMFVFIVIFGWVAFPRLIVSQIKKMLVTKPGTDIRELYTNTPFPLVFKVYMFNVTNSEDVALNGAMPILQEVGPFIYDEWKSKVDIVDNEADDTLTFRMKDTFIFNQKLSGSFTGNEVVTIPHPLIVGMVMTVMREKPAMATLANKAVNSIFKNPKTPFVTASVNDILFGGLTIDCTVTDFAGKAVCTQLKSEAEGLVEVSPNVFKVSIFGPKNGTAGKLFKVYRGVKNSKDLGRVIEFDEKTEMSIWGSPECNQFQGTDTTIFPPFLTKEDGLVSFAADICRSLIAYYVEETSYAGIPCWRYAADFGDMSQPDQKCFCPSPTTCMKKGVTDLMKCVKAPLVASLPHFYLSDQSYVNGVKGLNPNEKDHGITILFESMTGSPLSARKRLQFSIPVMPVPKIAVMKGMPDVFLPMFWVEEGIDLNTTWTDQIKKGLFRTLTIVKVAKWMIAVLSLCGAGVAGFMHYKAGKGVAITPVHAAPEPEKELGTKKSDIINMLNSTDYSRAGGNHFGGVVNSAMTHTDGDKY